MMDNVWKLALEAKHGKSHFSSVRGLVTQNRCPLVLKNVRPKRVLCTPFGTILNGAVPIHKFHAGRGGGKCNAA